jgi:transposase
MLFEETRCVDLHWVTMWVIHTHAAKLTISTEDHLYNCETMLPRLQEQGYQGSLSLLKAFVHTLRPRQVGHHPILRYETKPGEQMQFDWGEVQYEHKGQQHKLYGFTAILGYSRMRFVTFVKRCDTPTMIRCMMEAFEYFGGLPQAALTDRMKSVFLEMDGKIAKWNPVFADFMASIGVSPRVCKAYTPQTKGKVERTVEIIKKSFWPGVHFTDIDDLIPIRIPTYNLVSACMAVLARKNVVYLNADWYQ